MYYTNPEDYSHSTCRKTIWQIYRLAPTVSWFCLQVLSESTGAVLASLDFCKHDDEKRQAGEQQLYRLIGDLYARYRLDSYTSISSITCEFRYGFGCDYKITLVIYD